jgi:hypothetical protein
MGIFDSDWQRLHKKISRQYELIYLKNLKSGMNPEDADVSGIIAEIVGNNAHMNINEARNFVKKQYESYRLFDVRESIAEFLRRMNPEIPETGISEIYEAARCSFCTVNKEHEYFLFFIISKVIEIKHLSISRGAYIIEIARGRIPKPCRLVRFFQLLRSITRYQIEKDRKKE